MKKIYMIGDMHTVSAFRLSGVEGMVSHTDNVSARLEEVMAKKDAGIILLTNRLAVNLQARIREINFNVADTVIIEIPGIDDTEGLSRSAMRYVSEALGIPL